MDQVTKALVQFLVRNNCPPRICYTCVKRSVNETKTLLRRHGFNYCRIHPDAGGISYEDHCDDWTLRGDMR
jgi:hypothetical protein